MLFESALKAPRYIKSAVRTAAPKNLGPENFLGSGVKRKSLAGLYSVSGAVGLGASTIAYNVINIETKQSQADKKTESAKLSSQALCRAFQHRQMTEKRSLSEPALNAIEDYGKIVATSEGVAAGVLAVHSAKMNIQESAQPSARAQC